MNARILALSVLLPLLVPLAGCGGGKTDFWLPKNDLLPMVALDNRVALVEKNSQTAFILDPADPSFTPRMEAVGKAPVTAVKRNANNKLLVLSKGDLGSSEIPEVAADLRVIDADPGVATVTYPLTGRFDGLAQSGDGRFLVLYHSPSGQGQVDSTPFNPNELMLVDFTPPPTTTDLHPAPRLTGKSIRSLGGVPSAIFFSPVYPLRNGPFRNDTFPNGRTLAVVLSQSYVTILDLDNPDNTEISVPLCPTSTNCTLSPVQVLFDPAHLTIFVRANNSKDIFQIALTDLAGTDPPPKAPSNDFLASMSMLAVGSNPADMVLYGSGSDTRIAVASSDARSLVIIDPSTSHTTSVATSIPTNRIIPFTVPGLQPTDPPRLQALLVDSLLGSMSVLVAKLEEVETTGGIAIKDYSLGAAASEVYPLVDQGIVVLVPGKFSGDAALTVVDLTSPPSFSAIGGSLLVPTLETRNPSRLWSVALETGSGRPTGLRYLDLVARPPDEPRLTTGGTWLDQEIISIVPLAQPSSINGPRYVVAGHNDPNAIGNLTFLDAEKPDRAKARTAHGFLFTDYLKREQP
jgi:hypothetical protein